MKRLLPVLFGVLCSTALLFADEAGDLYVKGSNALAANDNQAAVAAFDQIITDYPSSSNLPDVRLRAGSAYLALGNYPKAIERLQPDLSTSTAPAIRAAALFYTGYAQLLQANSLTDSGQRHGMFTSAADTMTQLIAYISTTPNPDTQGFLEEAYYNRALAHFYGDALNDAEKDLQTLLAKFPDSTRKSDYLLLLGNLYGREVNSAIATKSPATTIQPLINNALQAFAQASSDPNALVQANEANLAAAEVLYLVASQNPGDPQGYQKALNAFRSVHSKNDLIPEQQANVDKLRAQNQALLASAQGALSNPNSRLIQRESDRLASLKGEPDPAIQALIGIAECYNGLREGDEARTVLHRLAQAALDKNQQKEVEFATLYSYVLADQAAKAEQALDAFLAKYPGDPEAQSINVQIGDDLLKKNDYAGALAQADFSLQHFPQGANVPDAIGLKARALTGLGRLDDAKKVEDDYLHQNGSSNAALTLLVSRAQGEAAQGDLNAALADYKKVADNPSAGALQPAADSYYIQTLQSLGRFDDVILACNQFATKYPENPALPNVLVLRAIAMDQKHDPGAIAALQDIARKYPADTPTSPGAFALYYVLNIYQRSGQTALMIQTANELRKNFPTNYPLLAQAADAVSAVDIKQRNFAQAVAEYQSLATAPVASVAAMADDQIGNVWLKAARAMGAYQSMQQQSDRDEAEKRLSAGEQAFLGVLKNYPDQLGAVGGAFHGLDDALVQRRSWGLLKDSDFEAYFTKLTAGQTEPQMQPRLDLAKAGLVFIEKDGAPKYPTALDAFRKIVSANPQLVLTRDEANRYGELLLAAKDYSTATQVYTQLLNSDPKDQQVQADADYGLGATYFAQGDLDKAKTYFTAMKNLNGGAAWHPHILDADYGLAYASEQSGEPADRATAKQSYADIMQAPQASVELQAKAMLGYGRILEDEGHVITPAVPGTIEYAVHYFQQVDTIYGPAVPELSAEGLYDAGQAYDKAGDKADAQKQYQALQTNYHATAPDWVAKAQAAVAKG